MTTKEISIDVIYKDNMLHIKITDTALGIAPENLGKIFEFFYTSKPPSKGTGLGLPISKRIIENQGGQLLCESQVNKGTTFTILLPVSIKNKKQEKKTCSIES